MYFELQLSAAVFTHIVRNRLKAMPLCIDKEFIDAEGALTGTPGARVVVDRLEIGSSTWIQREQTIELVDGLPQPHDIATQLVWIFRPTSLASFTVPFLQVKQELLVHLVKASDLEANGRNATPPFRTLSVYAVYNVALNPSNQTQGGGPLSLSYSLGHIDFGLLFLVLSPAQRADLQTFAGQIKLPPTSLDLGPLTAMLRRPVAAINAGIVCDPAGQFVVLRADFDVYASPVAVDRDFFLQPPENLLDGRDWAMLVDANLLIADATEKSRSALTSDAKVRLNTGPSVGWDAGGPALNIHAEVELVDACPFFIDDIDMDADVNIQLSFDVPVANTFRTHYNLTGSPSDLAEEIACAITGALLWPFIGPLFLKGEDIGEGLGAYFTGLAAGPLITFVGILAAIETTKMTKDIAGRLGSTCVKLDDENYECKEPMNILMQLTPANNSRLNVERVFGVARGLVIAGTIAPLREYFPGNLEAVRACPFMWQVVGGCTGNGQSNFRIANQATIDVIAAPPAGLCRAYVMWDPAKEFALTVNDNSVIIVPQFTPAYTANPYPCQVRLVTNRGVRTLTFDPPAALGAAENVHLEEARAIAHMQCYYWERQFTPLEKIRWQPDPPPYEIGRRLQLWQIAVRGLQEREDIRVDVREGVSVMTARPSRVGVVHMTLLFSGDEQPDELSLSLLGREGEDEFLREMTVQQLLYVHQASLPFAGVPRAMSLQRGLSDSGAPCRTLIIEDERMAFAWDVTNPQAPMLLRSAPLPDERRRRGISLHNGKRITTEPSENFMRALERIRAEFGEPEAVGNPRVGGVKESLYVRTGREAMLFDISDWAAPRRLQDYDGPAWFENLTLGDKTLVRYDARSDVVELYLAASRKHCQ